MPSDRGRSFSASDTHFQLVRSRAPVDVDGCKLGEPTGVILCVCCWQSALNIDAIDHDTGCPQAHVHSEWWRDTHDALNG
jgi:hypothetical protein